MAEVATNGLSDEAPLQPQSRWKHMNKILSRPGPFTDTESFEPSKVNTAKLLVIGAGGLGCEILKDLALSGFKDIHVIDMDTIDVSNLNRQFLFREADIGKPKAEVAAAFVERRVQGVKITPYVGNIKDKDEDYYMQFDLVVCGLDNIEARRWINSTLANMVDMTDPKSLKPLVDGGTEGFKGQMRVIFPTVNSCIECQIEMHAPRPQVPLCTIATRPRQPEHCIEWAHQILWEQERPDDACDTDDPDHITWLYQKALERAQEFSITGVTYSLTQGVVKNIIPAIASTNAIIAAACCNEAFKLITSAAPFIGLPETSNYMFYNGDASVYTHTYEHEKKDDCPVCGNIAKQLEVDREWTLQEFIDNLADRPEGQLKNPSLGSGDRSIFYPFPPDLYERTRPNLKRKLSELLVDGDELVVTDPAFPNTFKFRLAFRDRA